jgi:hypothetical protein
MGYRWPLKTPKVTNTPGLNLGPSEARRNSEVSVATADGTNEVNVGNNAALRQNPALMTGCFY